ncbi:sugar transferase [Liquorilactobacillus oeni]|uniref:Beta-1,6-galactofuranosyltransferase n=1 Tax=Liquorilactobacillus oeni DSM 19972 TaxID=1423777 RepID=A0A0R1MIN2_9LACO|nr:sugar transferase [Liquorilactobacillus oeni]KRL05796.1 beta-1,6-galactofuranosyltransferase [Liquorilactobacillus oeni DSM 19972]
MKNYTLSWHDSAKNTGGVKAKSDAEKFVKELNYKVINTPYGRIAKVLYVTLILPLILRIIKANIILVQFPSGTPFIMEKIIKSCKKNPTAKLIMLIHDVEALRFHSGSEHAQEKKEELERLNLADGLIVHNEKMIDWLKKNGITTKMVSLQIFDYDNPQKIQTNNTYEKSVCFAGNLKKSKFLEKMSSKNEIAIYGLNPADNYSHGIVYKGLHTPEELPKYLTQNFGLVWDGSVLTSCDGIFGEYMKFNNPHKTSLYLSSGIPVIIWDKAALADFVVSQGAGIALSNLEDLDHVLDSISTEDYKKMRQNAIAIGKKMRKGYYLKQALKKLS